MSQEIDALKYPIGRFKKPEIITKEFLNRAIEEIAGFPEQIEKATKSLSDSQLDTVYRDGGWTIRQVVHHCADSHLNSIVRFKLALTEDKPVIKPYFEERWALLADSSGPVLPSLQILEGLHYKWVVLFKALSDEQLEKVFIHPEHGREIKLKEVVALYAWHGKHHLAHITETKKRNNWQ